jgi:hypothetical protein
MTKTKIAICLVLIFIAGAVAGGAIVRSSPQTFAPERRPHTRRSPEEFANHLWNEMKGRLNLNEDQEKQVEPVFRSGFEAVRSIQDKSLQEVEVVIRKNHEEISALLNDTQKAELEKMDQERQDFFKNRGHRPPSPGKDSKPSAEEGNKKATLLGVACEKYGA